ncbi:MAG: site-specific DNA-methyltransferase [Dehalococcoidia bacterium]
MPDAKQRPLGDELFGTPMEPVGLPDATPIIVPEFDLDTIQADSETQELPDQEKVFRVAKRVRSKLHNLPDPTRPPLGFVPGRGFDVVFPFIKLPHLAPNLNGDWVQFGSPDLEPNRLYYGDNLQVLRTLSSNSIDLIYIDPPFFSGADYNVIWGDTNEVRTFTDIWEGGLDTYLIWLNARLWEMRRVLKSTGSIYVHCDYHACHYIKTELDKIFGYENFRNEVIWQRTAAKGDVRRKLGSNHDVLLTYGKTAATFFEAVFAFGDDEYTDRFRLDDGDDRGPYRLAPLDSPNPRPNLTYVYKGYQPPANAGALASRSWSS